MSRQSGKTQAMIDEVVELVIAKPQRVRVVAHRTYHASYLMKLTVRQLKEKGIQFLSYKNGLIIALAGFHDGVFLSGCTIVFTSSRGIERKRKGNEDVKEFWDHAALEKS